MGALDPVAFGVMAGIVGMMVLSTIAIVGGFVFMSFRK
jgi:hypothetical protein